jgi:hypothetical protein
LPAHYKVGRSSGNPASISKQQEFLLLEKSVRMSIH